MLLLTDPVYLSHAVPVGHPERPERLAALLEHVLAQPSLASIVPRSAEPATATQLQLVHGADQLSRLKALAPSAGSEFVQVDPDTVLSPGSLEAARCAAGAMVHAVAAVLKGPERRAFCAVRPPGHHAERDNAMGFCLFNSIAVGAATALTLPGVERVAILDFDVHHGNGSVDIFRDDPRVLVCSSFQHPFYPFRQTDVAGPHLVYTPLVAGTSGPAFRQAIERDWLPALARHQPQLILVSAGFDAHRADPLAALELDTEDFRWITELIVDVALDLCQGRIVSTLEGGYDLPALCASACAHLEALTD